MPDGAQEQWRRGLVYLRKREIPTTLAPGAEYRIAVGFKLKLTQPSSYRALFRRVTEIADARISQIAVEHLHVWTIARGWGSLPAVPDIAVAFVALGLKSAADGDLPRESLTPEPDWSAPGGDSSLPRLPYDEFYNGFDFGGGSNMVSYGESVESCEAIDYAPFVERAERMTAWWNTLESPNERTRIVRRSWYCVTNPNLVTVEIYSATPPDTP